MRRRRSLRRKADLGRATCGRERSFSGCVVGEPSPRPPPWEGGGVNFRVKPHPQPPPLPGGGGFRISWGRSTPTRVRLSSTPALPHEGGGGFRILWGRSTPTRVRQSPTPALPFPGEGVGGRRLGCLGASGGGWACGRRGGLALGRAQGERVGGEGAGGGPEGAGATGRGCGGRRWRPRCAGGWRRLLPRLGRGVPRGVAGGWRWVGCGRRGGGRG